MDRTTIAAIATPIGVGGIGIIRVSGPLSLHIAQAIFRHAAPGDAQGLFDPISHRFYYGHIVGPEPESVSEQAPVSPPILDEVLLVMMKSPRSYTREDVLEIHVHSGPAVMRAIFELILQYGAVSAEPGEFTRRAFLNGRIDLTQAEAVIDIINARSESARRTAAAHIQGAFKHHIEFVRSKIQQTLAETEAAIDFPDDVGEDIDCRHIQGRLQEEILPMLNSLRDQYEAGHFMRDGLQVVVAGKPNVGKSSLMNRLLDRDRAIVASLPGTTRDFIEESLWLGGIHVVLTDTAGVHSTEDPIEKMGIERSVSRIESADLVLLMTVAGAPLTNEDKDIFAMLQNKKTIWVENKNDLVIEPRTFLPPEEWRQLSHISISALHNHGIDELRQLIEKMVLQPSLDRENALIPTLRQKGVIENALAALAAAEEGIERHIPFELVNIDLRHAYDLLGDIIGVTYRQDVLDEIFQRFCIGK